MLSPVVCKNKQRIIIALLIGISLHSFYSYQLGIHFVSISAFLVLTFLFVSGYLGSGRLANYDRAYNMIVIFYVLLLISSFSGLIFFSEPPHLKKVIAFLLLIISIIVASNSYKKINFSSYLSAYLIFHGLFFYIQLFSYLIFGVFIDFIEPITGEAQRHSGGTTLPVVGFMVRCTGLFNEPGTYATFMAPFIALFARYYHDTKNNKIIFFVSIMSLILSLSAYGILYAVIIVLFGTSIYMSKKILLITLSVSLVFTSIYERFVIKLEAGHAVGISFRENFIVESIRFLTDNVANLLFGAGLLRNDARANFYGAFNDVGLFFYTLHFAGIVGGLFLLFVLLFIVFKRDRSSLIAYIVVLSSKLSLLSIWFPFILTAILYLEKHKYNTNIQK